MELIFLQEDGTRLDFVEKRSPIPAGSLYEVISDTQSPYWGFQPRPVAPDPAVNRTGPIDDYRNSMRRSPFTAPWQWFWVDLLSLAKHKKIYRDLTRTQQNFILTKFKGLSAGNAFITNNAGTDKYRCDPCKERLDEAWPKIDPLICVKSRVQVLEIRNNAKGMRMGRLNGFDYRSTPPGPDLKDPRVMFATVIEADGDIKNFGHLGGIPVPYPYIQFEPCWYPMNELQAV